MNRRVFLKGGALSLVTLGLSPSFLRRTALAMDLPRAARGKTLIVLFQRGAADALNVLVPFGDAHYYTARPQLAIGSPARGNGALGAIDLDGYFGLHPSLARLKPLWDRGLLAPIHAVGSPSATRSHFDAQDYMETGTPDRKGTTDGWLNRYLAVKGTCESCAPGEASSPFRAVAMASQTPRILEGASPVVAMTSIEAFSIRTNGGDAERRLEALYRTGNADLIHGSGRDMFEALRVLRAANPLQYRPAAGVQYPGSPFGQRLLQIAQLIKAGVGLEVAFADVGGWDTHVNQGAAQGQLANRLTDFGDSIAALVADLDDRMDDVVILTCSEFGRTVRQNGTGGTDHGHAGAMFVVGGSLTTPQRVHGRWPGLAPDQLYEGRDLALTTDFRAVFSEVAARHLGAAQMDALFPGYRGSDAEWLGLLRG
ncbi:MAG: DUF1501 domain-containing protein [Gemmatimonas sp.]|jgi:uncharacterized protein (DUF1501 family)|uniref:DUF1501 domain-containing protein n=1 Tax=Gemmatimonas sp. TaxID=1962908 RepID=UPI00391F41EB|nr:DUF1501 domain-containing protein [Gemmatimonadota bacterium]